MFSVYSFSTVYSYAAVAFPLFFLGLSGIVLVRRNLIIILMCLEMMLFAVNLILIGYSVTSDDAVGQLFALLVLTVAAAESAIGLAILVIYYRLRGGVSFNIVTALKG